MDIFLNIAVTAYNTIQFLGNTTLTVFHENVGLYHGIIQFAGARKQDDVGIGMIHPDRMYNFIIILSNFF